jgi:hypothetical protein
MHGSRDVFFATYRAFLNKLINFVGVGLALYCIASMYEYLSHDPIIKRTVKCRYCRKYISDKVRSAPTFPLPFAPALWETPGKVADPHAGTALCQLHELVRWARRAGAVGKKGEDLPHSGQRILYIYNVIYCKVTDGGLMRISA